MDEATTRTPRWARRLLLPAALMLTLTFALAACGDDNPTDAVATLSGDGTSDENASNNADNNGKDEEVTEEERQQAVLDFARCMREHGVDMPDPTFDEDGRGTAIAVGGEEGEAPPDEAVMKAAQEACEPIMEDVVGPGGMQPDPEEEEKMQQQALAFAKCMREHGIDMPDPVFEEGGRMTQMVEGGDDPAKFEEAQEACAAEGGGPVIGRGPGAGSDTGGDE